ncbi:hypothetical protein [Paenibacillus sp. NPDC093718]
MAGKRNKLQRPRYRQSSRTSVRGANGVNGLAPSSFAADDHV